MSSVLRTISKALSSRVALNIYIWALLIFEAMSLNVGNEAHYHYGIIYKQWYYPFMVVGFALQMLTVYVNNLWLAPKYLRTKKYGWYFLGTAIWTVFITMVYTYWVKVSALYINVDDLQQPAFVSAPVHKGWSLNYLWEDTVSYLFGNVGWIFVFTLAWYLNEYRRQSKLLEEAGKKQIETELNFLKNQINPHFLFNTLNNLYGLALKHADSTPDAILKLSSILRYMLYESNTPVVAFSKEKEVVQAYIELELLRITNTSGLHFEVESDREDYNIAPLLWLPVLENLFKHGTRIISDDIEGNFRFVIKDGMLNIFCENNYKGVLQLNGEKKEGGIGLQNLAKRLQLLYPGKHSITTSTTDDRYTIAINVEL